MNRKLVVLDYGIGNVKSICNSIEKVGCEYNLTKDKNDITNAIGLIIPGVGAFSHGMEKLKEFDLVSMIQDFAAQDKPILGICLGMQMLFSRSFEFGETKGLTLIEGNVDKLMCSKATELKLPHISWNGIFTEDSSTWSGTILDGISNEDEMYFVHSFVGKPTNSENILSSTIYNEIEFCSTVEKGNIYGCQYHPEKSSTSGLKIIKNFINICQG